MDLFDPGEYQAWERGNIRGPRKGRLLGTDSEGNNVYEIIDEEWEPPTWEDLNGRQW